MKKIFTLLTFASLASASVASADQYYQSSCPSCPNYSGGGGYYQDQSNYDSGRGGYYQDQSSGYYSQPSQSSQGAYYYQQPTQNPQGTTYYSQQPTQQTTYQNQQNDANRSQNNNVTTNSDQDIQKKIQDALSSGWFSKGFQDVSANVNNGIVTLRGSVDSLESKNKVEERVRKIDGVKQLNNQITIAKTNTDSSNAYTESQLQDSEKKFSQDNAVTQEDRQLNAKIRDKLSNGWFSRGYEALILRTRNGIVMISGPIEKSEDAQKITETVKGVDGVKSVNNQLTVK